MVSERTTPVRRAACGFEERDQVERVNQWMRSSEKKGGMLGQVIQRSPMSSVLTGFGLGFGFGLAVTLLISRRREETWYERTMPETIQHLPERFKRVPETIASYVPQSWKHS